MNIVKYFTKYHTKVVKLLQFLGYNFSGAGMLWGDKAFFYMFFFLAGGGGGGGGGGAAIVCDQWLVRPSPPPSKKTKEACLLRIFRRHWLDPIS